MKKSPRLTGRHLLGYALGDFGGCMTFNIMGSFLTRYYINVTLLDTALIAALTLIWKLLDVISNPIIGMLMDRAFAKGGSNGRFRPWMLRAAPLVAVTAILVFTAPTLVTGSGRLVVVFTSYLFYEFAYTMHSIPYGSLLSAMSGNDEERASLSSARAMGGMLGSTLPLVLFPLVLSVFDARPAMGYSAGVTLCAAVGFVCCLLSVRLTEERVASSGAAGSGVKLTDILVVFRKNRAYLALCIHGLCNCAIQSVASALGTYLYSDVLGNLAMMSMGSMAGIPVSILFMLTAPKLSKRLGLERLIRTTLLIAVGLYGLLFGLHVTTAVNVWVHILLNALAYGFANVSGMMQWGLLGQTIDYNERLTGKRTEGSIYGTFNMVRRIGQAMAASGSVAMLGWIGYDPAVANLGLSQSSGTILGIKVLCVLLPAVFALGSWAAFRFLWRMDE